MNRDFFDRLNDWIRDTENSIVNFLSAFAPWLAPLIPAYMTYQHAVETLEFPPLFAFTAGVVVEILGFTAVSTYLSFWFYNRRNPAESKRAPIVLVIIAFSFYLVLIVFSNVLLDTFPGQVWAEIAVRALYTLQTIPAAMLVSVRTQHRELLSQIAKERAESKTKLSESKAKETDPLSETFGNFPKDMRQMTYEQGVLIVKIPPSHKRKVADIIGVTERTIENWQRIIRERLAQMESK